MLPGIWISVNTKVMPTDVLELQWLHPHLPLLRTMPLPSFRRHSVRFRVKEEEQPFYGALSWPTGTLDIACAAHDTEGS
jgi:hypothetical protein